MDLFVVLEEKSFIVSANQNQELALAVMFFFLQDQDEIIKIFCTGHHKLHSAKFSFNWPPELIKM